MQELIEKTKMVVEFLFFFLCFVFLFLFHQIIIIIYWNILKKLLVIWNFDNWIV